MSRFALYHKKEKWSATWLGNLDKLVIIVMPKQQTEWIWISLSFYTFVLLMQET